MLPRPDAVQVLPSAEPSAGEPALGSSAQRVWLGIGVALAAPASAAAFLTENPLYLRVALRAVCWAFVIAALLAGSRRADQVAMAAREVELRHAYGLELAREVAARHEYQAQWGNRLRREAEQGTRAELGQLRTELTALTELRSELSGLQQLRAELAGPGELRSDLGRMRSELTEQLSGELLIERMVMRAQPVRGPAQTADASRTVEGAPPVWETSVWTSFPAGQDAQRGVGRALPMTVAEPFGVPPLPIRTPGPSVAEASASARADEEPQARRRPPSPLEWLVEEAVLESWVESSPRSPLAWLGETALIDADGPPPAEPPVVQLPSRPPLPEPALRVSDVVAAMPEQSVALRRRHRRAAEPDDGVQAPSGDRSRRRRYREEGEDAGDDVLARVLGRT